MVAKPLPEAVVELNAAPRKSQFNFNKFQAAVCIMASALVSIALIAWAINALF
jgi:hypothetical protein